MVSGPRSPDRALGPVEDGAAQLSAPARSAAIATVLALPFALIYSLLVLHIEPPLGLIGSLTTVGPDQPNVVGSAIVVGTWALAVVGFVVDLLPIVRDVRAGHPITKHPVNLALAIVILFLVAGFVVSLVIDQYPCWIGVPNCD